RREVDHVRRQTLAGDLEARARAGRRLEEQVDDRAAAQRRDLLHLALPDLAHVIGGVEQAFDLPAVEVLVSEAVPPDHESTPPSGSPSGAPMITSSRVSSCPSTLRSCTCSLARVGTFFPA